MTREEAIKKIKEAMPTLWKETKEAIQVLVPELCENDNERIRKDIINYIGFEKPIAHKDENRIKEMITYLERLKEQNPEKKHVEWREEDVEHVNSVIKKLEGICRNQFVSTRFAYSEDIDWLKSLPFNLKKKNEDVAKLCSNEWSEEDEETLACAISVFEDFAECKNVSVPPASAKRYLKRLKSLRPQQKKELTEEEKNKYV